MPCMRLPLVLHSLTIKFCAALGRMTGNELFMVTTVALSAYYTSVIASEMPSQKIWAKLCQIICGPGHN